MMPLFIPSMHGGLSLQRMAIPIWQRGEAFNGLPVGSFLASLLNGLPSIMASARGLHLSQAGGEGAAGASDRQGDGRRQRLLFLGTPQVAASALSRLVAESKLPGAAFEPVHRAALALGFDPKQVLTPSSAKEAGFLEQVAGLSPDVCVTAAYGGMLPQAFLDIPRHGTLNIHPSLLPRFRGAAPVQRALESGQEEVGVSLVYTVLECDAGPVLDQASVAVQPEEQAPELLARLFDMGTSMLLRRMADVLSGRGREMAVKQDPALATYARKVSKEEAVLDLSLPALAVHNRVRALAGWPGSYVELLLLDLQTGATEPIQVSVLKSRVVHRDVAGEVPGPLLALGKVGGATAAEQPVSGQRVHYVNGRVLLPCGEGTLLEVLQVKPGVPPRSGPMESVVPAAEFMRSLGKRCRLLVPHRA